MLDNITAIFINNESNNGVANTNDSDLDCDTVNNILSVVKDEYNSEDERNRHIEDKAKSLITLAGLLITVCIGIIKIVYDYKLHDYILLALLLSILISTVIISVLLKVIMVTGFSRLEISNFTKTSEMKKKSSYVSSRLVATYEEAINKNRSVVDNKIKYLSGSINGLVFTLSMMFIIVFIILIQRSGYLGNYIDFYTSQNKLLACCCCHR